MQEYLGWLAVAITNSVRSERFASRSLTVTGRTFVTELLKLLQLPIQFPAPDLPSCASADGSSTDP